MASVHRLPGKPNWICFYTDHTGKRRCKSTNTRNKKEAERVCSEVQSLEDRARTGRLTEDRARKVIESVVSEIMEACGSPIERKSIHEHFTAWTTALESECGASTFVRYKGIVDAFLEFLGAKANRPLTTLQTEDVERYRTLLCGQVASGTVNTHLKVIRIGLEKAVRQRIFDQNPARLVENVERSDKHSRRAFKMAELKKLLAVANDEWRGMIMFGLYTGQRLSDLANLSWANVDLQKQEFTLQTGKTGQTIILPIARPLAKHIETLPAGDDPKASLFPNLAGKSASWLSNQFYDTLASAGLVQSRDHQRQEDGKGRGARRRQSDISFHALRHTATSLLKNAGVSDVITRDIIGHESEAVSREYTHIDEDTKRAALNKMPDIFSS